VPQKKGGGEFSGLNTKPDTDGQPYTTIPCLNQGFHNKFFGLNAMNNPRKIISGDTLIPLSSSFYGKNYSFQIWCVTWKLNFIDGFFKLEMFWL
jgi:hypothetical protein